MKRDILTNILLGLEACPLKSPQPSDLTEQPSNETPQEQIPEKQACILIAEDTDSNYDLLNAILGKNYRLDTTERPAIFPLNREEQYPLLL